MSSEDNSTLDTEEAVEMLRVLGHGSRLAIMQILADRDLSVGEIETATAIQQPALSQQLAVLRKSELVSTRKSGKLVFYNINREKLAALCTTLGWLNGAGSQDRTPSSRSDKLGSAAVFAKINK